jgi:hypothetical protein
LSATLVLVVGGSLFAQTSPPRQSIPAPVSLVNGRWQVVNGAPEFKGMVMLLDTATGDTWQSCLTEDQESGWCKMFRSTAGAVSKK